MLFFPVFTTFSPSAWSLEALGTSEGIWRWNLWSCSPVGAEKLCGGGSKLELVRAHRGMGILET